MTRLGVAACIVLGCLGWGISAAGAAGRAQRGALGTARIARVDEPVIVLLKAQFAPALAGSRAAIVRTDEILASQRPLIDQLRATHATHLRRFTLVDSFAATVSAAERARLAHDPEVARVIPDTEITLGDAGPASSPTAVSPAEAAQASQSPPLNTIPGACTSNQSAPQLEPEGLALTNVDSDNTAQPTARSLGITGAGVTVGWIADGLDPNNENFIRPDGQSVFSSAIGGDYQDFSGDGPGQVTSGAEAFIDANTIAGQGLIPYNVQDFGAQPDSASCWIRIEGVAPGASLVGLDVFGSQEDTTESNFLQAINYAVETDHVSVLDESFGANNFPDEGAIDATEQFNDAAVAAGVFVTVATGDAGPFNTIGSPSSDPDVMSVGASTDFRFYAQTNYAGARYFATNGWDSNQISALSSSGFEESGATLDMVAPGDLSFASCDASAEFTGCTDFLGQPSDVEESGGTSESAPFVAGAAALVIQAYRQTHGASPSPGLIKQILTSTASDLGAPAQEQGSGLLNAYAAVELAESYVPPGSAPSSSALGSTLLLSTQQFNATGYPGVSKRFQETVTNDSATTQTVTLATRTFGPEHIVKLGTEPLEDSTELQFENSSGVENNYREFTFQVPSGAARLVGSLTWPAEASYCLTEKCSAGLNSRVRMILIDPEGNLAAHSLPQGSGSYGTVEFDGPQPGTWKAVIFGDVGADGGTEGAVHYQLGVEDAESFGTLSTSSLQIAAGQSDTFSLTVPDPSSAGDEAGSILLTAGSQVTTVPVTLRSLIDVATGGWFSGLLTGGNGRPPGEGQEQYYEFDVPSGESDIIANLRFLNDAADPVAEYLVNPDGDVLGYGQNSAVTTTGSVPSTGLSAYVLDPTPGRWTLILAFGEPTVGNELAQPYVGQIVLGAVKARASGVPDSATDALPAGTPVTVPIRITNTGVGTADYFVDARLTQQEDLTLAPSITGPLTLPLTGSFPTWVVPPDTTSVSVTSTATVPAMFDFSPAIGDPDVASTGATLGATNLCSTSSTGSYSATNGQVTPGVWLAALSECGSYSGPAPAASDTISMSAETRAFDPSVTSTTGDGWLSAVTRGGSFTPLVLSPWQTGVIDVTFTPTGSAGTVVSGDLFVDTLENDVPPPAYAQSTGDQLAAIPYEYEIAAG